MNEYADLEIGLSRQDAESYAVELRYTSSSVDNRSDRGIARFDFSELRNLSLDPQLYGTRLSQSLFFDPQVLEMFSTSCTLTLNEPGGKLRLRLFIDRSAPELHNLRWETLIDPRPALQGSRLLDNERLIFSRYLRSADWSPIRTGPKSDLRALIVVANPKPDSEGPRLAPVDVQGELTRARAGLGTLMQDKLVSDPNEPGQVTLDSLIGKLREGFDVLYLVCHGDLLRDAHGNRVPYLWLEESDGTAAAVQGVDFVDRLRKLSTQPRMIVLASCQSAGRGEVPEAIDTDNDDADNEGDKKLKEAALAALGPRLAEAGIPAVLAMQGNVSMKTASLFMPIFFQQLCEHGQIEQAMAAARGAVSKQRDWWMPVLFSRLRSGLFWYERGFRTNAGKPKFDWSTFLKRLHNGACTPILGYGLLESVLGSKREIACRWADTFQFPMEPYHRENLPQVAQFLKFEKDTLFPYEELGEYLVNRLQERYGDKVAASSKQSPVKQLDQLLTNVITLRQQENPLEPHRVLAQLPLNLYITTNPDNILATSLSSAQKIPHVELCPWNDYVARNASTYDDEPTVEQPLVFHLFGQLREPRSLVLTEDDYFDYLIGVAKNKDLIPSTVIEKQSNSQLLFIGFQTDDWNLRVLLRSIQRQRLRDRGDDERGYQHIAVQIDPDEDRLLDPGRARQFLEKYFGGPANKINIFWGTTEDFIQDLRDNWNQQYPDEKIQ